MIPILDLSRQYKALSAELNEALLKAAASTQYILGPNVKAFEQEAAEFIGVKHAIGCASGTDALVLSMLALKLGTLHYGEPAEILTTPFTYIATSETMAQVGATPVFVDVEPNSFNIDMRQLEKALTPRTKAIVPVHLYGLPCNMSEIMAFAKANGLAVIEDCAQAMGAEYQGKKVGSFGDLAGFSFFPSKNLGCMGDGGMVTTNSDELAERVRMLRVHGSRQRYYHEEAGLNSRLDDLQAAVLRVKLPHLNDFNAARQAVAQRYNEWLKPLAEFVTTPSVPTDRTHVFHQYTLRLNTTDAGVRDAIQANMRDAGVTTMIYYPVPGYSQQTHANLGCNPADFPQTEALRAQVLSLPMFPELTEDEQRTVVSALESAVKANASGFSRQPALV